MNPYLYHHNNQWMCFEGELPVKPKQWDYESGGDPPMVASYLDNHYFYALEQYEKEVATLKSKALPVANPQLINIFDNDTVNKIVMGEVYAWPGTVEWSHSKYDPDGPGYYFLHLPKPDMKQRPDEFVKGEPEKDMSFISGHPDRNWEEDITHENGNYICRCIECKLYFKGHKRRPICKKCANAEPDWESMALKAYPGPFETAVNRPVCSALKAEIFFRSTTF